MADKKRIVWLDMLRGFAMVCVILGHPESMSEELEIWIYSFHMPLFFMVSGMTFRYSKYHSCLRCIKEQAKRLLLPYLCLYLVNIPLWYINWRVLGDSDVSIQTLLLGILPSDQNLVKMPNGALWFLPALFATAVGYWLICDFNAKGKVPLSTSIIACFLAGLFISEFVDIRLPWHLQEVMLFMVFFHIGNMLFEKALELKDAIEDDAHSNVVVAVALACIAIGTWAAFANGKISLADNDYNVMALALTSSLGISIGVALMFMRMPANGPLEFIGKHSLAFLGFHVPLMRFFEQLPLTSGFAAAHSFWFALIIVFLLIPTVYVIERWLPFLVGRPYRRVHKK